MNQILLKETLFQGERKRKSSAGQRERGLLCPSPKPLSGESFMTCCLIKGIKGEKEERTLIETTSSKTFDQASGRECEREGREGINIKERGREKERECVSE